MIIANSKESPIERQRRAGKSGTKPDLVAGVSVGLLAHTEHITCPLTASYELGEIGWHKRSFDYRDCIPQGRAQGTRMAALEYEGRSMSKAVEQSVQWERMRVCMVGRTRDEESSSRAPVSARRAGASGLI